MSSYVFALECSARLIDPSIAIENPSVTRYLKMGRDDLVLEALDTEF